MGRAVREPVYLVVSTPLKRMEPVSDSRSLSQRLYAFVEIRSWALS